MQHTEAMLMALITGLYLYDSTLLVYANEAMLLRIGKDRWRAAFGSNKTTFKGKELFVPNPFLPTRPLFKLAWNFEQSPPLLRDPLPPPAQHFSLLAPLVWILFLLTFVALPSVMFGHLGDIAILVAFMLVYVNVALIIVTLWFLRARFDIAGRAFFFMAVDLLICPPFALNIIRRLSLNTAWHEDFTLAASRLLTQADWEVARAELVVRLDDEISCEAEDSERMTRMVARRTELSQ